MKKLFVILLVATTLLAFKKENTKNANLLGKWVGEDNSEIGYITFKADGNAYFEVGEITYGGEKFEVDGSYFNMYYTTNFDVTPFEVDFVVTDLETNEIRKMICIGEFIDKDTLNFAVGFDNERPTNFENKDAIKLTRVKE